MHKHRLVLDNKQIAKYTAMADSIMQMPKPLSSAHAYIWTLHNPSLIVSCKKPAFEQQCASKEVFYCTTADEDYEITVMAPSDSTHMPPITDMAKAAVVYITQQISSTPTSVSSGELTDTDKDLLDQLEI